jgi:thioredoxin reductase/NAD-dependent dihydropyrimidine dehydrogenase PreA subunit
MESVLIYSLFGLVAVVALARHLRHTRRRERAALEAAHRSGHVEAGPRAQHPHIDISRCIGCAACVDACPEGMVLGVIGGKAAIVAAEKCIGHGLCAEACPVGAIEILMAHPRLAADLPDLTSEHETSVPGIFVVGELGGLALIKNAVNQGRDCVDTIAARLDPAGTGRDAAVADVCIVGAGPGGISASLRAVERGLRYITFEQDQVGGTVAKYPRQKLVMTSPVEFPIAGRFRKLEISKEELLHFWGRAVKQAGLRVNGGETVLNVEPETGGVFTVTTSRGRYSARAIILALGRRGSPRKLGVPGEELPKVMYGLIDAEAYRDCRILVVGGGDSAVEAAMGLAHQPGNRVTLSYRGEQLTRIKARNAQRIQAVTGTGRLQIVFSSNLRQVRDRAVLLETTDGMRELANDYVFIFAGGVPPTALLEKIGVRIGPHDLTEEVAQEARLATVGA